MEDKTKDQLGAVVVGSILGTLATKYVILPIMSIPVTTLDTQVKIGTYMMVILMAIGSIYKINLQRRAMKKQAYNK